MLKREVRAMGKLHSQLALFGSIDDEVVKRDDPQTTAIVEQFLPGTTGYGQRGWYRELRTFVDGLSPTGSVSFPSRAEALGDLTRSKQRPRSAFDRLNLSGDLVITVDGPDEPDPLHPARGTFTRTVTNEEFEQLRRIDEPGAQEADPSPNELPTAVLARAIYAGAVLTRIGEPAAVAPLSTPTVKLKWAEHDFVEVQRPGDPLADDPLTALMGMATPLMAGIDVLPARSPTLRRAIAESRMLDAGRAGWVPFMQQQPFWLMRSDVAKYPPPCMGTVRKIGGQFCTVVSTELFDEDHELDALIDIVDPLNWKQDLPSFFCEMDARAPNTSAGWSRVLECVSTECHEYRLKTALKYWKATRDEHGIYINYDLDENRDGDSGLVEVDSGYIWITKARSGGVRIKTSKALKICGLSPTATAALACFTGWAQVGIDMFVNAADGPPGTITFKPSSAPNALVIQPSASPPVTKPPARLPELPTGFRQDLAEDAAEQANRYLDAMTWLGKNFIRRWQNGLTRTDIQRFGEAFGRELTELAVGSFDSIAGNFRPKPTPRPKDDPKPAGEPGDG
jgi:hypothetical protein